MRFSFALFAPRHVAHFFGLAALAAALLPAPGHAESPETEDWNAKFQATYVWQGKRAFSAAYSGEHSLSPDKARSYSFTATAMLGWRPWDGGELYFNPEAAQGLPLSNLTGLGGFTNGEMARSSGPTLKFYRARLFLRQTWGLGGGQEAVESGPNQLAGSVDKNRFVLTAGNLSVLDLFDSNAYSHDPRTQFMNWSVMTHGAYDYAADSRGYSWGIAGEWYAGDWVLRAGRFIQPDQPNQQPLDLRIFQHYGDQIELEHAHTLGGQPGKLRLLAFRNRTRMSRYQDALDLAARTGQVPSIDAVRSGVQVKSGVGLNLEQALSDDVGLFGRASWADGKTEIYAFTEIDRSLSGGVLVRGTAWGRGQDSLGLAMARNGLSRVHRNYLAAGGMGFFIGDGRLSYRPEQVYEAFYNLQLARAAWVTLDWQHIRNPAYNADRGPVNVISARLHTEF
ncbi:MAG: carbohydrate porin [Proteobacteria bacterium]|nr:carbohydrate porin [Pseudomonadota bacterium]MBS0493989.1 carbohydrate porin [Pseudomonadota bacterium]